MHWDLFHSSKKRGRVRLVMPFIEMIARGKRRRFLREAVDRLGLSRRTEVPVFYDPSYRLPMAGLEASMGIEPRRADFVVWFLLESGALAPADLHAPRRVVYADLARVHSTGYLESLGKRETLAPMFAVDPSDIPVDETISTVRLACGGTLDAARAALRTGGPAVNLLGGFHHAFPDKGSGMCAVNDMAVAVAVLRAEGFGGRVAIIDLDAHPPDGTSNCLRNDPDVWIGFLSGLEWNSLQGVDETVLPIGCGDESYLRALAGTLSRMPKPELAFVIAGGDVLDGDKMGRLGLSLEGARRRDLRVSDALEGVPSVWLPGGGYHRDAWKVLAGSVLAVAWGSRERIPDSYDPLSARYSQIWSTFGKERPELDLSFSAEDLEGALRLRGPEHRLLLGHYSAQSIEFVLHHTGLLAQLQRMGYGPFRVEIDEASPGELLRVWAESEGAEHVLMECVVERKKIGRVDALYVHWMTLRNPRAQFSARRPQLPGQELPGLGLAREAGETLAHMARELGMQAVVFRPAWYHMAYAARYHFRYLDPRRQGRFEAILRDLGGTPLREATLAFAEGRVRMNGVPYTWEADEMAYWLGQHKDDRRAIEAERSRVYFTLAPRTVPAPTPTRAEAPAVRPVPQRPR